MNEWQLRHLSYFFGAWLGDGSCYKGSSLRTSIVGVDKEILIRCCLGIRDCFYDLRLPNWRIDDRGNQPLIEMRWNDKYLYNFVIDIVGDYKLQLPSYIWSASTESKLAMLAGLMDTDGTIKVHKQSYTLGFSGTLPFVGDVIRLFLDVGIEVNKINVDNRLQKGTRPITTFFPHIRLAIDKGFYFRCHRKQYRLEQYMLRYNCTRSVPSDWISNLEVRHHPEIY